MPTIAPNVRLQDLRHIFLMFGWEPILPIDLEFGITNPMLVDSSHENFAKKLGKRLQWAYKVANECIQKGGVPSPQEIL